MFKYFQQLLKDDRGMVHSVEYLFLITVTTIGMIVGLSTFRDQIIQEFGDTGVALEQLDQSYQYNVPGSMSEYDDNAVAPPTDPDGDAPGSIVFDDGFVTTGTEKDAFGSPVVGGENNLFGP